MCIIKIVHIKHKSKIQLDYAQRVQTSAKAKISTKSDPGLGYGFPD